MKMVRDGHVDYGVNFRGPVAKIRIAVTVARTGAVEKVALLEGSGSQAFDRAMVNQARTAIYRPATLNCKPILSIYDYALDFVKTY